MKICVFADVHGNYEQLKKLTSRDDFKHADLRICLGDMVGLGPYQKECMDELMKYDFKMVLGNHEARMTKYVDDISHDVSSVFYKHFEENRQKMQNYIPFFENLPLNYDIVLGKYNIRFTHYGWSKGNMSNKDIDLKDKDLSTQFGVLNESFDYIFYGHIHSPGESVENGTKFVDVGSLGLKSPSNYVMIDFDGENISFERKSIDFDYIKFIHDCKKLNYTGWERLSYLGYENGDENRSKTILITGGAGYIGCNVIQKLAKWGNKLIVVDNLSNSHEDSILRLAEKYLQIKFYNFDLLDYEKLEKLFIDEKIDLVIHLAGKKYVGESFIKTNDYYENNVVLTQNLLKILTKYNVKNLIFSSSVTVYGKTSKSIVDEETSKNPLSPYASQKSECEELIKFWAKETNSQAIVLRLSNPIGANVEYNLGDNSKTKEYLGVLPLLIDKVKSGEEVKINGGDHPTKDGSTVRDYVHVEDVASAFEQAAMASLGEYYVFNIGSSGQGYSVLDILHSVENNLGIKAKYFFGERREGDVSVFISNNQKAKEKINFVVTKNLDDMVASQIQFSKFLK